MFLNQRPSEAPTDERLQQSRYTRPNDRGREPGRPISSIKHYCCRCMRGLDGMGRVGRSGADHYSGVVHRLYPRPTSTPPTVPSVPPTHCSHLVLRPWTYPGCICGILCHLTQWLSKTDLSPLHPYND
ncbi:hypothetical protein J6590_079332 [Homalodisca vitripennis]|nr:hypothetical protein J6590_079332 [Homalodisca vitripennis]